jgi:hypothetical protein
MIWKQSRSRLGAAIVLFGLATLSSCGHDQKLVSIAIKPSGLTFEGVGAQAQLTAIGQFIHPPEFKDITTKVLWQIDVANLATVTSTGLVTALNTCGSGDVTATYYSNPSNHSDGSILVGSIPVKGVLDGTPACQ